MTRAQFDTWLRGTHLTEAGADGVAVLSVRTTFARELLETRFREHIEAALAKATGRPCTLRVVVGEVPAGQGDAASDPTHTPLVSNRSHYVAPDPNVPVPAARTTALTRQARARTMPSAVAPSLFTSGPLNDAGGPAPVGPRRLLPTGAARRMDRSGGRAAPSTERVRAAVGRASASERATGPDATERANVGGHAPKERRAGIGVSGPSHPNPLARRDESDGFAAMKESSDPQARRGPSPAGWDGYDNRGASSGSSGESPVTGSGSGAMPTPRLNPRYTFSTFIVGSGNQLAHAASQAVAEAPGQAYNPLFLYGGVGLGKTHLLHAIGHKALRMGLNVLYVSSETFTNEIINAIRYRTQEEFRDKYRSVDMLLVDDIQFIAGKDSTEEEFFHTFNSLYEMSKQIVICSDRPPKAIVSLEERLRSRFEWGLIADIQPPDHETRVAILRAKSDMVGRVVPDEVLTYLAGRVQSNIRELEGSFNRLLAFSQLQGLPLTVETAKAALSSIASDGRQRRVSVAEVLAAVAEYYRIPADDLRGKQRDKHIVVPRQVAMYLMRQETEASLLEIGQSLGGRDHSTVLHGYDKIGREINENTGLRKEVLAIRQQLLG
jgi:chromosomal replication initiator protein DnaA